jgi:hypothetical protein
MGIFTQGSFASVEAAASHDWKMQQFITNKNEPINSNKYLPAFVFYFNDSHTYLINDTAMRQSLLHSHDKSDIISLISKEANRGSNGCIVHLLFRVDFYIEIAWRHRDVQLVGQSVGTVESLNNFLDFEVCTIAIFSCVLIVAPIVPKISFVVVPEDFRVEWITMDEDRREHCGQSVGQMIVSGGG